MTAITWREPAVHEPAMRTRGAHRRPAGPRPRKRLLPGRVLRKLIGRAAFEVAVFGGMLIVAGWLDRLPLALAIGAVLTAAGIAVAVMT